jgi:hypothetical protein
MLAPACRFILLLPQRVISEKLQMVSLTGRDRRINCESSRRMS